MSRRRLLGNDTHLPNIHQRMPSESNAMRAALSSHDTWRQNDGYARSREGHSSHQLKIMPNLGLDVSLAYVPLRKLGPC